MDIQSQYHAVEQRYETLRLGMVCVLCRAGIPGGTKVGSEHHEILPRSELPGENNAEKLFSFENVALACPFHHRTCQHARLIWMKAMVMLKLATVEQYRQMPYAKYWRDEPYPPTAECYGRFGYGTDFFARYTIPQTLGQLYRQSRDGFDASAFCKTCTWSDACERMTKLGNRMAM